MTLKGPRVLLRQATGRDAAALLAILREPVVAARWGSFDGSQVDAEFIEKETVLVIEVDGEVIGAIQFEEEDDPMYRHAGLDIFVTTDRHGQGFATEAIAVLARHLITDRGHHRLTIDPAVDNAAAVRAYEKVGFRRVGVMRDYERGSDGTWHDGLLMELLADELIEP